MSVGDRMSALWTRMITPRPREFESNQAANVALVAGIAALVIGVFYMPFAIVSGLFALVCGILGLRRSRWMEMGRNQAIAGIVLGGIATISAAYFLTSALG